MSAVRGFIRRNDWHLNDAFTLVLLMIGLAVIWLPARPPMADVPQHAAQLTLLRDLLLHRSPWAGIVHINVFTPYLLGYCLALPLSFVVSSLTAIKLVLSGALVAFVGMCRSIRAALGSTTRLDALFCLPFFGFAYSWGFYTFLVAAPVGLAFIRVALDFGRAPRLASGVVMASLGVALLFCHGLIFLIAFAVGGAIMLAQMDGPTDVAGLARRAWPFVAAVAIAAVMFASFRTHEPAIDHNFGHAILWGDLVRRLVMVTVNSVDAPGRSWPIAIMAILLLAPWRGGLRIDWRRKEALMIGLVVIALVLFAPSYALSTSLLFERVALFLLPAYAWMFVDAAETRAEGSAGHRGALVSVVCAATVGLVLVIHAVRAVDFSNETKDFDRVMAAAQPRARAMSLIFDRISPTQANENIYFHLPSWYSAEHQGFVDFSFAYFPPEMVRFSPATAPRANERLSQSPETFTWSAMEGWRYRYFFVRSKAPLAPDFFAPGQARLIAQSGEWSLYENPDWQSRLPAPRSPRP